MKTILLDTNIFDKLAADAGMRDLLARLGNNGHLRLIISRTVRDELSSSPHIKLLTLLSIDVVGNAVPIAGLMCAGDLLGDATHYFSHKGNSSKVNDAQVATAAAFHADWLISEDRRLKYRQQQLPTACETFTYAQFVEAVLKLDSA